jgi:hypothetical protein
VVFDNFVKGEVFGFIYFIAKYYYLLFIPETYPQGGCGEASLWWYLCI